MTLKTTINLSSSQMKFAAGHFTIFSATERENIHGHNFKVMAKIEARLREDGLAFNYQIFKSVLGELCQTLDEKLLLPTQSPFLKITQQEVYVAVQFAEETLLFLPRDVYFLPIANISIENLAQYFLEKVLEKIDLLKENNIAALTINVSSSPSQSADAVWIGE